MIQARYEIHISTKNRKDDLLKTLSSLTQILQRPDAKCIVFDDGSTDGTYEAVQTQFPQILLKRNDVSKGYLFCRNTMLNESAAEFAISLDDDANFLSENPLDEISNYFHSHQACALIAFRIFWGKSAPRDWSDSELPMRVNSYVGCGHAWRISGWNRIPSYPEWFGFYGEENFASFQLFRKNLEVHYVPKILVHHRVDMLERKKQDDNGWRLRRSLRSGWYLYFLFLPWNAIPKKLAYSIWMQWKNRIFKGDFFALKALFAAKFDTICAIPNLLRDANRLTASEYKNWKKIPEANIFWKPKSES